MGSNAPQPPIKGSAILREIWRNTLRDPPRKDIGTAIPTTDLPTILSTALLALLTLTLHAQTTHKTTKPNVHKAGTTARQTHTTTAKPKPKTATRGKRSAAPAHTSTTPHLPPRPITLPTPTTSPLLYRQALAPLFSALAAHQLETASPSPNAQSPVPAESSTVRILQFGDSHTAADIFTGQLRADLQARFGDGGLGFQYPGHPFPGYHLAGSTRAQSAGWLTEGNKFTLLQDGDTLGLGGISIATTRPGEWITLSTTCTTLQLHFLRQPSGGRLAFTDNGLPISEIATASDPTATQPSAGTFTYACTPGLHDFALTTLDRAPVRLLGLVTEQPGITYECLGINGAVAPLILRWNQQVFAEYLRQRDPTLIVLAYGTNEAGQSSEHNAEYVASFNRLLDNLHTYVPAAAILVLGPYDRATRTGTGRKRTWQTFHGIDRIIADQIESCRTHNCAFYDQRARMGGPGTMLHWATAGYAQPDRTHLTGTGYRALADALANDLLTAFQQSTP